MDLKTALLNLEANDYFIWDDFLSADEVSAVLVDYHQLHLAGSFRRAGVGKNQEVSVEDTIRKDEIYWLDLLAPTNAQSLFLNRLETLRTEINQHFFLGLWTLEGHYSHYPIGGHYRSHLDRFNSDDTRTISVVLYLNSEWKPQDGGELRIHSRNSDPSTLNVSPTAGRLVCFFSAKVLHEVLTTQSLRLSFAGWWKRRH